MKLDLGRSVRASTARLAVTFAVCAALCTGLLAAVPASAATGPAPTIAGPSGPALAADLSQFRPGNIISDAVFYNPGTMSEGQIQAFLDSKVRSCAAGNTCLKDYYDTSRAIEANAMCGAYQGGGRERASTIIFRVAQACGLNPQVILVMLEKEQSLITHTNPSATRYRIAMGQGCPDTAACDTRYYGFFNQVMGAAWQLKRYGNPPGTSQYFTWYPVGRVSNVLYNPNAACGSSPVLIENKATAALYYYTPYQPNAAALRAGYGLGDGCSAYGNRNFYQFFTDWFGASTVNHPFGRIELVRAGPGDFNVIGWAADPDTAQPISIHVYANDRGLAFVADAERPDVGGAYPALGSRHGFNVRVPAAAPGANNVCVYAINYGGGANVLLGCVSSEALSGSPLGVFDPVLGVDGGVAVSGWAIDPDTTAPTSVHVYVDGVGTALTAGRSRSDMPATYAAYGTSHGFAATLPAAPGPRTICAYAINVGPGGTTDLGCQSIVVPGRVDLGRPPVGALEKVTVSGNTASVVGWAVDPDTAVSIQVHIYVGSWSAAYRADKPRADVGSRFAGLGDNHGFSETVTLPGGTSRVCAYGINTGAGGHALLGCMNVSNPASMPDLGRPPIGNFEALTVTGNTATASGWALDPDTARPIAIHLYVGAASAAYTADKPRPDVELSYPAHGADHGFTESIALSAGSNSICAYAINNGVGGHAFLGCRNAVVQEAFADLRRPPYGNFEAAQPVVGGATVSGWAIDPDTSAPIAVHIYVDSASAAYLADKARPDVAAVHRGYGDLHGFTEFIPMASGSHRVCVYPINNGAGGNTFLGCRDVTVP